LSRRLKKEAALRILGTLVFAFALVEFGASASAEPLAGSGTAKMAAYQVCHALASVDMGPSGSGSATDCNGIVRNLEGQKPPDNLAIHCLESTLARPEAYRFSGTCVQTDHDGDKLFMTYDGSNDAQVMKWVGGTGKYHDVSGSGKLSIVVAPKGTAGIFAYTLNYDVDWTNAAK
jgi:uncharacterized protein YfaT (DUF1175 family)